jgi:flagellar biosynthesis/type III secretory pathway ATPase
VAAIQPEWVFKGIEALAGGIIAAVDDPSVGRQQRRRARAEGGTELFHRDLIQVGAYVTGTNPELDEAIRLRPSLETFLRQDMHEGVVYPDCVSAVRGVVGG